MSMKTSEGIEFALDVKGSAEAAKQEDNPGVLTLAPGESVELQLLVVNANDQAQKAKVTVRVVSIPGQELWSQFVDRSFAPGKTEITYKLFDKPGAPQEGQFLAQVLSGSDGKELAWQLFSYFPAVPDIPENEKSNNPILILRDRKVVGKIPAERTGFEDILPNYTRFDPILARASDGELYVMFAENHYAGEGDMRAQRPTFLWSSDGGRTWQMRQITLDPPGGSIEAVKAIGIAEDDQLFVAYCPAPDASPEEMVRRMKQRGEISEERFIKATNVLALFVASSKDQGKTWSKGVEVDVSKYVRVQGLGRFYQGSDGAIWFTCTVIGPGKHIPEKPDKNLTKYDKHCAVIRSRDGGRTWGDISLMVPNSTECQLLHLASGGWLTTARASGRIGDRVTPDGKMVSDFGFERLPAYERKGPQGYLLHKRTFIAESKDGRDWGNLRQLTTLVGDTPGELLQLPDGRVVFIYSHRYNPHAGPVARVSHDEGRTWQPYLLALQASGYSSSTILKDGTIVSIASKMAVRWRLPDDL